VIQPLLRRADQARETFAGVQGNARVIVLSEGVGAIFFQWYTTYLPLYMLGLGVSELQIGLLTSLLMASQFVSTLLGGYVADRYGRKRVLVIGDIICWGIPMLLYAIARNPWYFVIGRIINGFVFIVVPSFECLFVEDVPEERRAAVFSLFQFLTSAASLFAPVAGIMVAVWSIVPAGRVIMTANMISAISLAVYRQFTLHETTIGIARMSAMQTTSPAALAREYAAVVNRLVSHRSTRGFLVVRNLVAFVGVMWTTYAAIYLADPAGMGLPEGVIALLPFASAIVTLGLILLMARRIGSSQVFGNLLLGGAFWIAGGLVFLAARPGALWLALLYAALNAIGIAFYQPANQSHWANIVSDHERAAAFSAATALTLLITLPAGPLAGALYTWQPKSPFVLSLGLLALALALIVIYIPRVAFQRS
jgi:MFS family permease